MLTAAAGACAWCRYDDDGAMQATAVARWCHASEQVSDVLAT